MKKTRIGERLRQRRTPQAESVREKTSVYRFGAVATREWKAAGARRYRIESVVWRKAGRNRLFIGERFRLSV